MSPQALWAITLLKLLSNNNNFINFIQSTFLFVQRLNAPIQREKLKNSTVPQGIYTFEVVWSVA